MEAYLTISGYVGGEVEFRRTDRTQTSKSTFRLACTPRVHRQGCWTDDPTTWVTVTCWRALADHVASSVGKGDPVIVVGRVRTQTWTGTDEQEHSRMVIEATTVGHDLTRGTSAFRRVQRIDQQEDRSREGADVVSAVGPDADADPNDDQLQGADEADKVAV
jgi:single-strand DNA-binding protein